MQMHWRQSEPTSEETRNNINALLGRGGTPHRIIYMYNQVKKTHPTWSPGRIMK